MTKQILELIKNVDLEGLEKLLTREPGLANEELSLDHNPVKAHPLHRICDGVGHGMYTDHEAAQMARIFLAHGAHIDGNQKADKKDTPLVAAASLWADEVALLYIDTGADIHHRGCHGGTALHWAAWCGRDRIVRRLIEAKADIELRCIDFNSTPLLWAVHGYASAEGKNRGNQVECARLLIAAGADKETPNAEGKRPVEFLRGRDTEMKKLFA